MVRFFVAIWRWMFGTRNIKSWTIRKNGKVVRFKNRRLRILFKKKVL